MSVINTAEFIIDEIEIRVGKEPGVSRELDPEENATDFVELIDVVTHIQFYSNGEAELWVNVHLGNKSDEYYVSIKNVVVKLENADLNSSKEQPNLAEGGNGYVRENGPNYLWNEVTSPDGVENDWRSMFDDYTELSDKAIFDKKDYKDEKRLDDRLFLFSLDQNKTINHLICNPVTFTTVDNSDESYGRLIDLHTMVSESQNILLPKSEISKHCPECEDTTIEKYDNSIKHTDVMSFWLKWDKIDVTIDSKEIDFEFEFMVESNVGKIKHLYMYYILPPNAKFVRSLSKDNVNIFKPRNVHWMFKAWQQTGNIKRTGPDNRVLRSKLKDRKDAYNLAEFLMVPRERANALLENITLTLIPALIGTFASALLTATILGASVDTTMVIYLLLALFILAIISLIGGIYMRVYDKYTVFSKIILSVANKANNIIKILTNR